MFDGMFDSAELVTRFKNAPGVVPPQPSPADVVAELRSLTASLVKSRNHEVDEVQVLVQGAVSVVKSLGVLPLDTAADRRADAWFAENRPIQSRPFPRKK